MRLPLHAALPCLSLLLLGACAAPAPPVLPDARTGHPERSEPAAPPPHARVPPATPAAPDPASTVLTKASAAPPGTDPIDRVRDARLARATRARPLLVTEISQLEMLRSTTSRQSPDRGPITRRVAETYVELARTPEAGGAVSTAARTRAIETYRTWLAENAPPGMDASRHAAGTPEVLYDLALELERGAQLDEAKSVLLSLVQDHPASVFVDGAYVTFGELFLRGAAEDPARRDLALVSFRTALHPGGTPSRWTALALARIAQLEASRGSSAAADSARTTALAFLHDHPEQPELEALRTLVP